MPSSPYRRTQFEDQIAGPQSGDYHTGLYPALKAVNSVSEILGPGRLATVKEVLFTITWPANSTQGVIEIEAADDPAFTGTWASLSTITWTAANKKSQFRFTGAESCIRCRVSTAVDGSGATITAKGVS